MSLKSERNEEKGPSPYCGARCVFWWSPPFVLYSWSASPQLELVLAPLLVQARAWESELVLWFLTNGRKGLLTPRNTKAQMKKTAFRYLLPCRCTGRNPCCHSGCHLSATPLMEGPPPLVVPDPTTSEACSHRLSVWMLMREKHFCCCWM